MAALKPDGWRHDISWDGDVDFRIPSPEWSRVFSASLQQWVWYSRAQNERRTECPLRRIQPPSIRGLETQVEQLQAEKAHLTFQNDGLQADLQAEKAKMQARESTHKSEMEALRVEVAKLQSKKNVLLAALKEERAAFKDKKAAQVAAGSRASDSSDDSESSSDSRFAQRSSSNQSPTKRQRKTATASTSAEPNEKKKKHRALIAFESKDRETRAKEFWQFYDQCLRGEKADDKLMARYCLGGCYLGLPDVQHFLSKAVHQPLADACWRAFLMVWTGTGGPGGRTIDHLYGQPFRVRPFDGGEPLPENLPPMPEFSKVDEELLRGIYNHVKALADRFGKGEVFGGDGQHVKFRTTDQQGVKQLVSTWKACTAVVGSLKAGAEPEKVRQHLFDAKGMGPLAGKEIFCYLSMLHPDVFNPKLTPWGSGARRGAELVLDPSKSQGDITSQVVRFIDKYGQQTQQEAAVRKLAGMLPEGAVAGRITSMLSKPSVLCIEVCLCWFQSWLKRGQVKPRAPKSWQYFSRELWPKCL